MKRFLTIPNRFTENQYVDYKHVDSHDDTRIVDESSYVSNKRANQILAKQFASTLLDNLSYDNPQDIASNSVNVYARQKGRDIAELFQQMRTLEAKAEKAFKQDIERLKEKQAQDKVQVQTPPQNNTPTE